MKEIKMNVERCGYNGWYKDGTKDFKRVSRWITVRQNYNPTKRNSLWDYVMDESGYKSYQDGFNPVNGLFLDYFRFGGRTYAVEGFLACGNPFWNPVMYSFTDTDGKTHYLSGVEIDDCCNPLYVEFDEYCTAVRVYEEV